MILSAFCDQPWSGNDRGGDPFIYPVLWWVAILYGSYGPHRYALPNMWDGGSFFLELGNGFICVFAEPENVPAMRKERMPTGKSPKIEKTNKSICQLCQPCSQKVYTILNLLQPRATT